MTIKNQTYQHNICCNKHKFSMFRHHISNIEKWKIEFCLTCFWGFLFREAGSVGLLDDYYWNWPFMQKNWNKYWKFFLSPLRSFKGRCHIFLYERYLNKSHFLALEGPISISSPVFLWFETQPFSSTTSTYRQSHSIISLIFSRKFSKDNF